MRAVKTHDITPDTVMGEEEKLWVYNGLDCCVTAEVFDAIAPQLDEVTRATYEFSLALQAPVLEMGLRGILVDQQRRSEVLRSYQAIAERLTASLNTLVHDGIGLTGPFNYNSPIQLKHLLYDVLQIPPIHVWGSRGTRTTVDREALEQLRACFYAQPLIAHVLRLRDITKKMGVLRTTIDPDGRMRTSYNIAGTTTGRFSSSLSSFGTGTNLQNIEELLRSVFVADAGMKLAYIDLEQAESRLVGAIEWNLFGDGRYLDACESGDLHTSVCKLAWTGLEWTGDLEADRKVAEQPFYRQHSYRRLAKVLGHGTNYNGKPDTLAKSTHLARPAVETFQAAYFRAFPAHRHWHAWVATQLREHGYLVTLTGRRRWFFGRRDDPATVREAIAYDPQGSVGDILNRGMLQVWRADICQLLLQIHDAVLVQYPEREEDRLLPTLLRRLQVPLRLRDDRPFLIPSEAKTGWNWGHASTENPDGLLPWRGLDARRRARPAPSQLDRVLHRLHLPSAVA